MPEIVPFEDDDLLIELMDQYKPHLKPYAYRLQTWSQVLDKYNALTDNNYRQTRTLKKKFERLKELYQCDAGKIQVADIKKLERLVDESDQIGKKTHTDRALKTPQVFTGPDLQEAGVQDSVENSSDNSQPPPLDSITVGFPHSTLSPHQQNVAVPPKPEQGNQQSGSQEDLSDNTRRENYEMIRRFFRSVDQPGGTTADNVDDRTSNKDLTLENFYLEFRQYRKTQEEFEGKLLHKLDLLIESINKK